MNILKICYLVMNIYVGMIYIRYCVYLTIVTVSDSAASESPTKLKNGILHRLHIKSFIFVADSGQL